jgi:hypothetical protein
MRTRSRYPRSTSPVYFIAFWLAAAVLFIVVPVVLTGGH